MCSLGAWGEEEGEGSGYLWEEEAVDKIEDQSREGGRGETWWSTRYYYSNQVLK